MISAMLFVTSLGWIGLQFVVIRFVSVAGERTGPLIAGTYAVAAAAGLTAGIDRPGEPVNEAGCQRAGLMIARPR